jgi:hypothetical protein
MDEHLTDQERRYMHYIAERLSRCRAYLLEKSDELPLQTRLERAIIEGFSPTLTDWFAEAHSDLREEWEAIQDDASRLDSVQVTLGLMDEEALEELEARVLAFVHRYLVRVAPPWAEPGGE